MISGFNASHPVEVPKVCNVVIGLVAPNEQNEPSSSRHVFESDHVEEGEFEIAKYGKKKSIMNHTIHTFSDKPPVVNNAPRNQSLRSQGKLATFRVSR